MRCFYPLAAFQEVASGQIRFVEGPDSRPVALRCGQCVGCRMTRAAAWGVRCVHEARMHEWSSFVTLTYDDEHLPDDCSLRYSDFQRFMRRLRHHYRGRQRIRFYMCGEYGERFARPHYHACLFGLQLEDRVVYKRLSSGAYLYTSEILSRLWPHGFSSVGDVTFESASYVARYCLKKVTGERAEEHYRHVTGDGEVVWRVPEFNRMSLKPGIGGDWLSEFRSEVYPEDSVVVSGKRFRPPKYYDDKLEEDNPALFEGILERRKAMALELEVDASPARLRVQEKVLRAGLIFKRRTLE